MNWVLFGVVTLASSIVLTIIGGLIYALSKGKTKVVVLAKNLLTFSMFLVMFSFVIIIYDSMTAYEKEPIKEGDIVVLNTDFIRVEQRTGVRYECEVVDQSTNRTFIFSSNEKEEVKRYCHGFEMGSTYPVFFKDVHNVYHLIKENK